jgi:hypothetical protein
VQPKDQTLEIRGSFVWVPQIESPAIAARRKECHVPRRQIDYLRHGTQTTQKMKLDIGSSPARCRFEAIARQATVRVFGLLMRRPDTATSILALFRRACSTTPTARMPSRRKSFYER